MSVTGEPGGAPVKCGVPVGDFCAGLYAAYTITAGVLQARQTGQGAFIDCSMLAALIGVAALQTSEYFGTDKDPQPLGSAHPRNAPYQAFAASDEHFIIAAGNDRLWHEVANAVGMPELADDPRFRIQADRARNQSELEALLAPVFATRSAAEWLQEFDSRGVPCAPINTYGQILNDPHVREMNIVRSLTLPNGHQTQTTAFPVSMTNHEFALYRSPPELGAHNDEVLSEWLDAEQD